MTLTDHARTIETKDSRFTVEPNPISVIPVTNLDRKRASYFGLRIPTATAPVAETPTITDPGDTWDSRDDQADAPRGLGPEAEPITPAAFAPRTNRTRFEPTPAERTEAAQMFRDDRVGSYFINGRRRVRSAAESPRASVFDLIDLFEVSASAATWAEAYWLAHPGNPDAILEDEMAQDAYLRDCEALIEAMAASGLEEVEHDGKTFRIFPDPDDDFRLALAC